MDSNTLRRLQLTELEILKVFDKFCLEHNLEYSLYCGSALGAIRHKGFIPWDDDIDVCMERNHYEKFLKLWKSNCIEGYFLQSDKDFGNTSLNHTKIHKDGTTFISAEDSSSTNGHNGIWLDVFALDKVPRQMKLRKKILFWAKIRLIYTRNHAYTNGGKLLELLSRAMLGLPTPLKNKLRAHSYNYVSKYRDIDEDYDLMSFASIEGLRCIYPANAMRHFTRETFEDFDASLSAETDAMLRIVFGDYMQLPPEEDRICKHKPLEISFGDGVNVIENDVETV